MRTTLTFPEYLNFHNQFMGLQLNYLWRWMACHPEEEFRNALRHRIDLCRKTDPDPKDGDLAQIDFTRPEWKTIEDGITVIYDSLQNSGSSDVFESHSLALIAPVVARFAELTYNSNTKFASYQCGSLKYDDPNPNHSKTVTFHIGNAIAPKSIFHERSYLIACFTKLMDETEAKFGADILSTETWLNSLPKWLEYFPQEWIDNLSPEDRNVQWHYGFWGQFIAARGDLNAKYAKFLRETDRFPFWPRKSHCTFKAMRQHLASLIGS